MMNDENGESDRVDPGVRQWPGPVVARVFTSLAVLYCLWIVADILTLLFAPCENPFCAEKYYAVRDVRALGEIVQHYH